MLEALTYAAVTPARDEEENLARLAEAMLAQTSRPALWAIVENGSSDGTLELARALERAHSWISVVQSAAGDGYDRTSPYMRAFHTGVDALAGAGDVVVKLDADVSFEPGFFRRLLAAFERDPALGIASGTLFEEQRGEWREIVLLADHVWGPTRAYRRSCLDAVLPLDDSVGYAAIDEAKAHLAGFRTATLRDLPFFHHRPEGAKEGSRWRSWWNEGRAAHYTGYGLAYLLARTAFRMRREVTAAALVPGYLGAVLARRPRCPDRTVIDAVRLRHRRKLAALARAWTPSLRS